MAAFVTAKISSRIFPLSLLDIWTDVHREKQREMAVREREREKQAYPNKEAEREMKAYRD